MQPSVVCTVGSFWDPAAREKAAQLIAQGEPVGAYVRGVCGVWGDGRNFEFVDAVCRIKGERRKNRPLAASLPSRLVVSLVDASMIPDPLRPIFLDADELSAHLGSLCFIRLPITDEAARQLPEVLVSHTENGTPILQNWDPTGHEAALDLVDKLLALEVCYPAITSMNISGQPEIVKQDQGIAFATSTGIPMFLVDHQDKGLVRGSYTILAVDSHGVTVVREGNIPSDMLGAILNKPLNHSHIVASKFPQPIIDHSSIDTRDPKAIRNSLIRQLHIL